ncbi:hypothetical protein [Actinomadura sp. WAC 06369]|uniref:hypothetical protein n=1 Tax=Actinomadura sp. WAC 06369 TaxID=2203193 RepID=UPI001F15A40C|nr:hypothetical protein [Actinomadura sp. WAC 06369]
MQPVLEMYGPTEFTLWPVAWSEPFGYMPLHGALDSVEVGTAVMRIVETNSDDVEGEPRTGDPIGVFLHGMLAEESLFAPGGMRVTDTATGTTLLPGCCSGIEEWREWLTVINGSASTGWLGHDPSPHAERQGDTVRLTVDAERDAGPTIELSVPELRRLLAEAERDLIAFHRLAAAWAARYVPDHTGPVVTALARVLDIS